MKICEKHWKALRKAIEDRGLMPLVAKDGKEAMARTVEDLKGGEAPFDPLMSCHWMITNNAIRMGGMYLMTGDYCPVCEAVKHSTGIEAEVESHWINGPADAALAYAKEHDLL